MEEVLQEVSEEIGEPEVKTFFEIKHLVRAFRRRLRKDYDVAVCITGDEGMGKTTLAIQLAMGLDPSFKVARNVLFDPDLKKLYDMVYKLPSESGIVVDETIRIAYKRRWQTANNVMLNELYTICRYRRQASFFCLPRFGQLDSDFQKRILFWIHIPERGVGVVFMKEDNPFSPDPWNVKESYKLMRRFLYGSKVFDRDLANYLGSVLELPNYVGVIRFSDLDDGLKTEYKSLKTPFELKEAQNSTESQRVLLLKSALRNCLGKLYELGLTQPKLVELTGLSAGMVNNHLKDLGVREIDKKQKFRPPTDFLGETHGT